MRKLVVGLALVAVVVVVAPGFAGDDYGKKLTGDKTKCSCPSNTARTIAWCKPCMGGVAFGHSVKSKKLIAALAGHEVKEDSIKCGGCKTAFKNNSKCLHCNVGFRHGMEFHSPVSLALAKGELIDIEKIGCPRCKSIAEDGKGECSGCKVGVVAGLLFKDMYDYKTAKMADTTLAKAIKSSSKCEGCAIAMVSDGTCEQCKVSFKGGETLKPIAPAKPG